MDIHEITLDERQNDDNIVFVTSHPPGHAPSDRVTIDSTVTLRQGAVEILVGVVRKEPRQQLFVGKVIDFRGHEQDDFDGVPIGGLLRFHERNVFGCRYSSDAA